MPSPRDIYAELGETLTRAILTGDFQLYRTLVVLPLEVVPQEGSPYVLNDWDSLENDFKLYHRNAQVHRVTDIYRQNISAEITATHEITASFTTHILAGALELVPPFVQIHVLNKTEDGWRIQKIISSLGHINWTLGRARVTDGNFVEDDNAHR